MSRKILTSLCAVALLAAATPAPAVASEKNEKQAVAPAARAASPAAIDYARRYAKAINLDGVMGLLMEAMMPLAIEAEIAKRPDISEQEKRALHAAATEASAAMSPRFADALAVKMASIFTEEELKALAEFYESPVGRSIAAKEGALTKAGEEAAEEVVPGFVEDMLDRLCRKIDCDPTGNAPGRSQS